MSGEALQNGIVHNGASAPASGAFGRHVSIEERRRLVAESLRVGNPGNNSRELPSQADPRHDCQIELAVDDIRPYENNPRRAGNTRFAEIKESIRSSGIRSPLTVTRRPGEEHFIVEAGGNTRLLAIQQLWSETRDARFQKLIVLFRPWRSESHVLTSHLIENELRGEMTFWDKASGVAALKARLEAEKGSALSLRQLEDEMKALGLSVNTATLAHCLFATERLRTLGEAVADLSGLDVKTMQPRLNVMTR
ncbi:MAG: ParB N-terminal domain-containing protein [Betaproteobacteria bacterium]|nr:ParB N-terminal domain-containing protein [Betaproteobacteria bacterium]